MTEKEVEKKTRKYLLNAGWTTTNLPKSIGNHGCDITAWHPRWRKYLFIEAKGISKHKNQSFHNGFYNMIGQIASRMDKEGNRPNRARIYALAIPATWEDGFKKKIKKMEFSWRLLRLKTFLVGEKEVKIKNHLYFLR